MLNHRDVRGLFMEALLTHALTLGGCIRQKKDNPLLETEHEVNMIITVTKYLIPLMNNLAAEILYFINNVLSYMCELH